MTDSVRKVEVFTQPRCAPCREVERFLSAHRVSYTLRDVTDDASALDAIVERGFMATPVTHVGERWIAGFRRAELESALHEAALI